ncbi:MAG: hypothetical protein AAGA69_05660 [Pseudomonadota bacterium]
MKKRDLLAGTGALAAALAVYTAATPEGAATAPALEAENVIVVDPAGTGVVAAEENGTLEASQSHMKWAFAAALGTLIGSAVAALGFNRLLNWLAASRKVASRAAGAAANGSKRVAKATIDNVARVLETPGRTVARASVLTVGALLAIALLDVSWKASLAVGGGAMLWSALGWRKNRHHQQSEQATSASA